MQVVSGDGVLCHQYRRGVGFQIARAVAAPVMVKAELRGLLYHLARLVRPARIGCPVKNGLGHEHLTVDTFTPCLEINGDRHAG
jgi:hypothetical protein